MANYASIEDVRKRGLDSVPPTDDEINTALALASQMIDSFCAQDFLAHNEEEIIIDGNDGDHIILGVRIREILSLTVNGNTIPSGSILRYTQSPIGEIALKDGYRFIRGSMNIKLNCSYGFDEIPVSIIEASAHLAAMIITKQIFSGKPSLNEFKSRHLLDYSEVRAQAEEIEGIIEQDAYLYGLLRPYRVKGDGV